MPTSPPEELRRFEYNGCLLVENRLPSALTYGPPTYSRWDIFRIGSGGSREFVGHERDEQSAKLVVDYIVNGKFKPKG